MFDLDDLSNHVKLKNSDKAKLSSAIKKLQSSLHSESGANESTNDTISVKTQTQAKPITKSSHECQDGAQVDHSSPTTVTLDPNEKKECISFDTGSDTEQPYTNDEMLNISFECDHCGKTMSQCSLFYCIQCNSAADPEKRRYYCKKGLLNLHNDHIKCRDHKEQVITDLKILTSSSSSNANSSDLDNYSGIVVKLTFDVAELKQKRDAAILSFEKSMVKYLNDRVSGNLHGMQATVAQVYPLIRFAIGVKHP